MAINAQFTADFTAFIDAAHGAQSALGGVQGMSETLAPNVEKQAYAAGQQIARFGQQVAEVGKQFIASYAEEEAAAQKLKTALEAQGNATGDVISGYEAMAAQFQATTKYSDAAVTSAQAMFVQIGHVGPDQMEAAVGAAADLASALGIDLESAAMMMSKALGTGGESLGKLKGLLGDAAPAGKEAADIFGAINSKFGGQAAADLNTYAGKMEALNNQFGDVEDTIGGLLVSALNPLLDLFTSLPEPVQTAIAAVAVVGTTLGPVVVAAGSLVTALTPLVALLGGSAGIGALLTGVGAALAAALGPLALVAGAVAAVYVAWKNWDQITAFVSGVYTAVKTYLQDLMGPIFTWLTGKIDTVTNAFKWMADKVALHSYVPDMVNRISDEFARLPAEMVTPAENAAARVAAAFETAGLYEGVGFGKTLATIVPQHNFFNPAAAGYGGGYGGTVNLNVYGSVLSTADQLASTVGDAITDSYRTSGRRLPV